MDSSLNNFELEILEKIGSEYPFLYSHIPLLMVSSRKRTGIGMYIHFSYMDGDFLPIPAKHIALSSKFHLNMEGLNRGLNYEISPSDGRIDFIELVTYDEAWDGEIRKFWFQIN